MQPHWYLIKPRTNTDTDTSSSELQPAATLVRSETPLGTGALKRAAALEGEVEITLVCHVPGDLHDALQRIHDADAEGRLSGGARLELAREIAGDPGMTPKDFYRALDRHADLPAGGPGR